MAKSQNKKSSVAGKVILALLVILIFALFMPFSNLFLKRARPYKVEGSEEFKRVSAILHQKCADCHTPELTAYPVYSSFPLANQIIKHDINEAQEHMIFSREMLSGQKKPTAMELARIKAAFLDGDMPPKIYLALHWDARVTPEDREALLNWIEQLKN